MKPSKLTCLIVTPYHISSFLLLTVAVTLVLVSFFSAAALQRRHKLSSCLYWFFDGSRSRKKFSHEFRKYADIEEVVYFFNSLNPKKIIRVYTLDVYFFFGPNYKVAIRSLGAKQPTLNLSVNSEIMSYVIVITDLVIVRMVMFQAITFFSFGQTERRTVNSIFYQLVLVTVWTLK